MTEKSFNIPINSKTIGIIVSITVLLSGIIGTWYVNNIRIENLERQLAKIEEDKIKSINEKLGMVPSKSEIERIEIESKQRDDKIEQNHKENINSLNNKMDQIEDAVHGTQLVVGNIAQDIKNVVNNIDEIKKDIKGIRRRK